MSSSINLKLFTTHPHACSYLDAETATTLFVDPEAPMDASLYSQLSELGFRRSGSHVYRPHCGACQACIPIRVISKDFRPNRNQRRCFKRNADLQLVQLEHIDNDECYELYERYISLRHQDGDMYPPSRSQYRSFLTSAWGVTRYLGARLEGRLVGVAVCDQLDSGLSAVYTFFDPKLDSRSLGVYFVLRQLDWCRQMNLPYLYLGYWVGGCQKMSYKNQYQPLQRFEHGKWLPFPLK